MAKKLDRIAVGNCVAARKAGCGYRIQFSFANCSHCRREFHVKGHETQMMSARCDLHDFSVNLDHGTCRNFKEYGNH